MLALESIAAVRQLLAHGQLNSREITRRTGVRPGLVALMAHGPTGIAPLDLRPEHYARYLPILARKRRQPQQRVPGSKLAASSAERFRIPNLALRTLGL
jgi:hypothetical protein